MLTIQFPIELTDGRIITPSIEIETYDLWQAYRCLVQGGMAESWHLVLLAGQCNFAIQDAGLPPDLWIELWTRIGTELNIESVRAELGTLSKPEDKEELLIMSFCYVLLKHRRITREEAAGVAALVLNRPYDKDAWRKKLDRWVARKGLEPLGQTKRPPRKESSGRKVAENVQ